ncbi:MAG: LytR cell envelope-related transcriptional attenuator, partial [Frankiales bacterium]|nr:LytR cell envelope-related transcriptional attenuator [Frankiales bacterium]
ALAAQGFHITGQGNNRAAVTGPSQVVYGPGASLPARTVSAWVRGSIVVPAPKARRGSVQLVLGSGYTRVSTPAEAAAAARGPVPTVTSAPSPSATVLRCRA